MSNADERRKRQLFTAKAFRETNVVATRQPHGGEIAPGVRERVEDNVVRGGPLLVHNCSGHHGVVEICSSIMYRLVLLLELEEERTGVVEENACCLCE